MFGDTAALIDEALIETPTGKVLTAALRHRVESDHIGCVRVFFDLRTRHFTTGINLSELFSHRLELNWLVYSAGTGKLLTQIVQDDASYNHPDLYLNLPEDAEIILVPSAPYIADDVIPLTSRVIPTEFSGQTYRYEINVGASTDSGLIGDRWSYREGRLTFMSFFHNKVFRWALDGAELKLPVVVGADHRVRLNAQLRTAVAIEVEGEVVQELPLSHDGVRWHDEDIGFTIPARLTGRAEVTVRFVFLGDSWKYLEFNLRQEALSLSRLIVDVFGQTEPGLARRVADRVWVGLPAGQVLTRSFFGDEQEKDRLVQTRVLVSPTEFELTDRYFAPHQHFWSTLLGLSSGLLAKGSSVQVQSLAQAAPISPKVVIGPLRFDDGSTELAAEALANASDELEDCGVVLSLTTASLRLCGLGIDDSALEAFAYRELYNYPFEPPRLSNFWEMMVVAPDYWRSVDLAIYENVLIGRTANTPALILASASAEDWLDNGGVDARFVLDRFCSMVAGPPQLAAGQTPCSVSFLDGHAELGVLDDRHAVRSQGGGIARGWPSFAGPTDNLPPISGVVRSTGVESKGPGAFNTDIGRLSELIQSNAVTIIRDGGGGATMRVAMNDGV